MRYRYARYNLERGFIQNWLAAGPQIIPIQAEQLQGDRNLEQIAESFYEAQSGIPETPVERGPLTEGLFQVGDYKGSWEYTACREDHFVDQSGTFREACFLRSWAYTQLNSKTAQDVLFALTTYGPADIWLNGEHLLRQKHCFGQKSGSESITAHLQKGQNALLVRFTTVALGSQPHAFALQLGKVASGQPAKAVERTPADQGIMVTIPTLIQGLTRRKIFERAAAGTYILQDVFEPADYIGLKWASKIKESSPAVIRLMSTSGPIYAEATVDGVPGDQVLLGQGYQVPEGPYRILMLPLLWEYYNKDIRITREYQVWGTGRKQFSAVPYASFAGRRNEALLSAAQTGGLFAEIAKMALGDWGSIEPERILQAAKNIQLDELLGILGMLARYGEQEAFPKNLWQPLEECILAYPFDQAADTQTSPIIAHAAEILAGQRYPERVFTHSQKTGQWHRRKAEKKALEWMKHCGAYGFAEWDSPEAFAGHLIGLSHLVDLAESEAVWELAAVVMDKLFFAIAVNSFQGVFGSSRGRTSAAYAKGGLFEPTSGITRLAWGTGIFNHATAGTVSLACAENYEVPPLIAEIATAKPDEMWDRERHAVDLERGLFVNKVTYKTPDFMLCSAQDDRPGEAGSPEHTWQATLGHTAVVFTTHPACSSESDAHRPSFWAGTAVMPRAAQWKDALIAIYHLPEDDWMGFTHAYFPIYAFDEYEITQGWAFARKGEGYLALKASQGFGVVDRGSHALRELRAYGSGSWLCQMGRAAQDGDFQNFKEKILGLPVHFEGTSVAFTTLRGETLSFGWQGPFLRNGQEQTLTGFAHFENPFTMTEYPCKEMDIQLGETILRLHFAGARRTRKP